ncbi:hypothetical protein SDRG_04336 [Saprolegnia diclina VS20]|uniref:JmjC domain-containing protein n=1 Tax=Saprolegnia diclina (strain VS20) TaxID=1156394 RepID=T0QVD8_SAPDV|nr:hypothetical protein SDRG_04336 [Saprolegnia diclina VS20]EQC38636.1 hypothetical protein SDRG_04336 [Saprolegnia diclina VS20]|eukprot:XP_008608228.1 hypothetical protein SDRG_04336 [Saprolegnia diclina VS20]
MTRGGKKGKRPRADAVKEPTDSDSSVEMWFSNEEPPKRTTPSHPPRQHRPRATLADAYCDGSEERDVQAATKRSLYDVSVRMDAPELPECLVFRPTLAEFATPAAYIRSIAAQGRTTGIAKIIPPDGWSPTLQIDLDDDTASMATELQRIDLLQQGVPHENGRRHTLRSYRAAAAAFEAQWRQAHDMDANATSRDIERAYWKLVLAPSEATEVEYANNVSIKDLGSGFPTPPTHAKASLQAKASEDVDFADPTYYATTAWNLNNLPFAAGSLLRYVDASIEGLNVPWLYFGMLFSTFSWHVEDNFLYSINYMHDGAPKHWYGVAASDAGKLEAALKANVAETVRRDPTVLDQLVTLVSPHLLQQVDVKVYKLLQMPGEMVVTFPRGYHCGFNQGFNCNEAVNFALADWFPDARNSVKWYRKRRRSMVIPNDRFHYWLGLRHSLDDMLPEDGEKLLDALLKLQDDERTARQTLRRKGLVHTAGVDVGRLALTEAVLDYDEACRRCCVCKHSVFFSGVICPCSDSKLACLGHAMTMCGCAYASKTLVVFVSMDALSTVVSELQNRVAVLSSRVNV